MLDGSLAVRLPWDPVRDPETVTLLAGSGPLNWTPDLFHLPFSTH